MSELKTAVDISRERAENLEAIPAMTDPLGKYWDQPNRSEIEIGERAEMSQTAFDKLKEYSHSQPTGVYIGKMWKMRRGDNWYLAWYGKDPDPCYVSNNYRRIQIRGDLSPI